MGQANPHSVWRRKPVTYLTDEATHSGLVKSLGLWQLTAIGVGGIVGVGIFSLAGAIAVGDGQSPGAGPAVLLSFLIAACASAAAALSYAEFAGMIPRAGSAYSYGYVALGEIVGWFIGWDLLLEYIAIVAVVAIGISGYLEALLNGVGLPLPTYLAATSDEPGGLINMPALIFCLLVTLLLSRGTKTFGRFELVAVGIKVALIIFIVVLGAFYLNSANFDPFMPSGFGPVLSGAATVFFAVFGYDAMSTAAEESKDGRRHMPKAILLSLGIAGVLYIGATLVLTGMQNYRDIDPKAGFASAFTTVGLGPVAHGISLLAILSIFTVMLSFLLGATRVWYAMSADGLLPRYFSKIDQRGVPQRVTWIAGGAAAILAGLMPIRAAADLTNIGILSAFVVVSVAVIVFRYTKPDAPRTFRLPFMPVVPLLGIAFSLFLISRLGPETWARFGVWLALGLVIYFTYSRRHSMLNPHNLTTSGTSKAS